MLTSKPRHFDKALSLRIDTLHQALETAKGIRRWWLRWQLRRAERRIPHD